MERSDFQMCKKSEPIVISAVLEMSQLVRSAAAPAVPGERVPHAIARAANRLGFSRVRVESFWYGKARAVSPEELERARQVAVERAKDAELLRHEYRRALNILARLEMALAVTDAEFHQPTISAVQHIRRGAAGPGNSEPAD
jgi:hypothetical protein